MNLEEEPEGDEDCIDKIHEIEMKNVEFRYPQRSESAVKNINLRILTGEKIAIVGENGSGKTTLLYLLLGIYRPISGEASVNGKTMELNLDNYRKKTACLIQNFVHFQMTLRENLAPNDFSELSEDPLIDFANNFPDRLNTFLGALDSNGVELSGGQWKRIALYRTLHKKDVDLIVLDEPTANLDPKISENIINRLLKPNYNKTVIVITHDFELAKKFDRIIGMKEGKIICDSPPQAFAWELFEKHNSDKRSIFTAMGEKFREFKLLRGGEGKVNPKITAYQVELAQVEAEIEKLLDTLTGANATLLAYANKKIEDLDNRRKTLSKAIADLSVETLSSQQIELLSGYLDDWEHISFEDKRKAADGLISSISATSDYVKIEWKI